MRGFPKDSVVNVGIWAVAERYCYRKRLVGMMLLEKEIGYRECRPKEDQARMEDIDGIRIQGVAAVRRDLGWLLTRGVDGV